MRKLISWVIFCLAVFTAYLANPEFFQHAYLLISHGEISALAEYLRSFGWATVAVIILVYIIMTFCLIVPYLILAGACGMIYGLFWGTVLGWTGEIVGAVLLFSYGRYFFRSVAEVWINKSRHLANANKYSAINGFMTLFIGRVVPLIPSAVLTTVASISKISFKNFVLATATGIIPAVFVKVLLGHDLIFIRENAVRLVCVLALIVIAYGILFWYKLKPHSSLKAFVQARLSKKTNG